MATPSNDAGDLSDYLDKSHNRVNSGFISQTAHRATFGEIPKGADSELKETGQFFHGSNEKPSDGVRLNNFV